MDEQVLIYYIIDYSRIKNCSIDTAIDYYEGLLKKLQHIKNGGKFGIDDHWDACSYFPCELIRIVNEYTGEIIYREPGNIYDNGEKLGFIKDFTIIND